MEDRPQRKRNFGGIYLAGTYIVLVSAVYGLTAYSSYMHPDDGMQRIPFALLASPWFEMSQNLILPGLIVNALVLFAIGTIAGAILRGNFRKKAQHGEPETPKSPESPA